MRRRRHPVLRVDAHVGERLRSCRTLTGLSQAQLAERIGITFQQVQKYENGANRISASTLYELSRVLGIPVSYFFEGLDAPGARGAEGDQLLRRETLQLARAYDSIPKSVRRSVLDVAKSVARVGLMPLIRSGRLAADTEGTDAT
jgi:transcriptional regulator with XRE-family HTH domain